MSAEPPELSGIYERKCNMKKRSLCLFTLAMMLSLTACGNGPKGKTTKDVTWDELLAANQLETVLEQVDGFASTHKGNDGESYIHYVAMKDGELIASNGVQGYTDDLRNGIRYTASEDGMGKSITILAPTANLYEVIDGAYGEELDYYQVPGKILANDEHYIAALDQKDEEWGIKFNGYAYFDKETLLLDRVEMTESMGHMKMNWAVDMNYNIGSDFEMVSYDRIVNSENTVDLTIHYPDGTSNDITVDRDVTVIAYSPNHEELWAACWDEACTGSVDDLGWIEGDHGDIYLCEGDIPDAPPPLNRVLELSSFESIFKNNYNSYYQRRDIMDENQYTVKSWDLIWFLDEENSMCLDFDLKNEDYEVIQSGKARNNAWYFWSEEEGYAVDFFDEFRYVEDLIDDYRFYINGENMTEPMEQSDPYAPFYIPSVETMSDGSVHEYKYHIHSGADFIEFIEITRKDSSQKIVGYDHWYLGGNSAFPNDKDILTDITAPEGVEVVQLTVVSPIGEKSYAIRKDAKISWKGESVYRDEACTNSVNDLSWADGSEAKVYTK